MSYFTHICKELRLESGLTQQELAPKIGISSSAIGMLEKGYREPTGTTLVAYANFFGVSLDYLMGREDETGALTYEPKSITAKKNPITDRPPSDITDNFINEFGSLFSEENYIKLSRLYKLMNEQQIILALGILSGILEQSGIHVKGITY
mgnify:FL=1